MPVLTVTAAAGDGFVRAYQSTWAATRAAATGDSNNYTETDDANSAYSYQIDSGDWLIRRAFFPFITSALPSNATIVAATLTLTATTSGSAEQGTLVAGSQASATALANSDFPLCGSTELATHLAWGTPGQNVFVLNAAGLAYMQANLALMKFCVREYRYDFLNVAPPDTSLHSLDMCFSEYGTAAYRPTLTITYEIETSPEIVTDVGPGFWVCPTGVTSVTVYAWGGGGDGGWTGDNTNGGGGGGGGAFATKVCTVTPGTPVAYNVGANNGDTWFGNATESLASVIAVAGSAGSNQGSDAGGQASACTPVTGAHSGGSGSGGDADDPGTAGGGAGSGGDGGDGAPSDWNDVDGGPGGIGTYPGGAGGGYSGSGSNNGTQPGGGGCGSDAYSASQGAGAPGQIILIAGAGGTGSTCAAVIGRKTGKHASASGKGSVSAPVRKTKHTAAASGKGSVAAPTRKTKHTASASGKGSVASPTRKTKHTASASANSSAVIKRLTHKALAGSANGGHGIKNRGEFRSVSA